MVTPAIRGRVTVEWAVCLRVEGVLCRRAFQQGAASKEGKLERAGTIPPTPACHGFCSRQNSESIVYRQAHHRKSLLCELLAPGARVRRKRSKARLALNFARSKIEKPRETTVQAAVHCFSDSATGILKFSRFRSLGLGPGPTTPKAARVITDSVISISRHRKLFLPPHV